MLDTNTKLRMVRMSTGKTIVKTSFDARVNAGLLSAIENGRVKASAAVQKTLCSYFGCDPEVLFSDDGYAIGL